MNYYHLADQVRTIELVRILHHLNCKPNPRDRKKYLSPKGPISVNGQKFMNWHTQTGGGGAIDLVIHLLDFSFSQAVRWLFETFSSQPLAQTDPQYLSKPALCLPKQDLSKQTNVRHYLVHSRKLSRSVVQTLFDNGSLYSDYRSNAVFLMQNRSQQIMGAEIRGTGTISYKGLAKGSCKKTSYFSCGPASGPLIALCESAIDAISFSMLFPHIFVISTAGSNDVPAWLPPLIDQNHILFCAFDSDTEGDRMAQSLLARFPNIGRIRPPKKDWNLCL